MGNQCNVSRAAAVREDKAAQLDGRAATPDSHAAKDDGSAASRALGCDGDDGVTLVFDDDVERLIGALPC